MQGHLDGLIPLAAAEGCTAYTVTQSGPIVR